MTYYKLLDRFNYGVIVKVEGKNQYTYVYGESSWQKTGILLLYFMDTVFRDEYEEVTEEQAYEVIKQTDALYRKLEIININKLVY